MSNGFGFAGSVLPERMLAMPSIMKCMYGVKAVTTYNNSIFVA